MKREEKLKRLVVALCLLTAASSMMMIAYKPAALLFWIIAFLCVCTAFVLQMMRMRESK